MDRLPYVRDKDALYRVRCKQCGRMWLVNDAYMESRYELIKLGYVPQMVEHNCEALN